MILNIYLIGVALAFVGLVIYHSLKDKRARHLPSDILFTIVMVSLSWITVLAAILSLKAAFHRFKERKAEEKRITELMSKPRRKDHKAPVQTIRSGNILKPIKSSELKKSIESFSEN